MRGLIIVPKRSTTRILGSNTAWLAAGMVGLIIHASAPAAASPSPREGAATPGPGQVNFTGLSAPFGGSAYFQVQVPAGMRQLVVRLSGGQDQPWLTPTETRASRDPRIIGGQDALIEDYPWQVGLLRGGAGSDYDRLVCGGSILSEDWVLTTASCATSFLYSVKAGSGNLSTVDGVEVPIARVHAHPDFDPISRVNDIALLRLSLPLDLSTATAKPISLMNAAAVSRGLQEPGVGARISGWGSTLPSGTQHPSQLQQALVPILAADDPGLGYAPTSITASMLPAGFISGGTDSCTSDTGGPLVVSDPTAPGAHRIAGVTSWGIGCAQPHYPWVYSKVSSYQAWLEDRIANHADLYLSFGNLPSVVRYDCRSAGPYSDESCVVLDPPAGTYHILVNASGSYSDVRLSASWSDQLTRLVTATAGVGGSISPGLAEVPVGATEVFSVTPDAGYLIESVSGCGGTLSGSSFVTGPITTACTVTATFSPMPIATYEISTSVTPPETGAISCDPNPVQHGGSSLCTAVPAPGYAFARWGGDCLNKTEPSCELRDIVSNRSVTAEFVALQPVLLNGEPVTGLFGEPGWQDYYQVVIPPGTSRFSLQLSGGANSPWNSSRAGQAFRQPRIIGGTSIDIESAPWQVALLRDWAGSYYDRFYCGGSILAADWILTAAHCVDGIATNVLAGTASLLGMDGQEISVTESYPHPAYDPQTDENDIALLKLSAPLDLLTSAAKPISLMNTAAVTRGLQDPGVQGQITGWGSMSTANSGYPTQLQRAFVPILANDAPGIEYDPDFITPSMMPAGYVDGGPDSCFGDSGGPLAVPDSTVPGQYRIAGITSWGIECGQPGYPGIYTRVSSFQRWIEDRIANHADLYLRFGAVPTIGRYICRSAGPYSDESCFLQDPEPGTYYVMISATGAYRDVTLTAHWD